MMHRSDLEDEEDVCDGWMLQIVAAANVLERDPSLMCFAAQVEVDSSFRKKKKKEKPSAL